MFFKTTTRAALAILRQNIKLVCFADVQTGILRVDAYATTRGKQDSIARRMRIILIYNTIMHPGSDPNPEQSRAKVDRNAMKRWLTTTLQQLDQHKDTTSPPPKYVQDEEMQQQ
jgi:hypothetical protein